MYICATPLFPWGLKFTQYDVILTIHYKVLYRCPSNEAKFPALSGFYCRLALLAMDDYSSRLVTCPGTPYYDPIPYAPYKTIPTGRLSSTAGLLHIPTC